VKRTTRERNQTCLADAMATAEVVFSLGQSEAQAIVSELGPEAQVSFAREFCTSVIALLWKRHAETAGCPWDVRKPVVAPLKRFSGLTERLSAALSTLPWARAGFLVGQLYTALLPDEIRKELGAFYTPPLVVERLIELATQCGFSWRQGTIIDPACGGAAFLASVAPRMVESSQAGTPAAVLDDIEARLLGIELDPFAAWMSMVLLDLALSELTLAVRRPLTPLVLSRDALTLLPDAPRQFDLVIGNPPYGKVTLPPAQRQRYRESLFGHANLYGLFTELAVRLAKPGGLIAYVTPTSFLGGEYFKSLRKLLVNEAPLQRLDFIQNREGVFEGVLQETMLAVFAREPAAADSPVHVSLLHAGDPVKPLVVDAIGQVRDISPTGRPWLFPRSRSQAQLLRRFNAMPHRLADYGFRVVTGQLVWNRHKEQLRATYDSDCYPIVWAEAVSSDGTFQFQAARRSHLPYLKIKAGQDFLINHEPCLLIQRTTAKEQRHRLIAAVIPNSFVMEYPGFVVENHLNMVCCSFAKPRVALRTLAALLNSSTLDQAFRCINGSVAVSAYELNSLALPNPEPMDLLQKAVISGASASEIETQIASFYASPDEPNNRLAASRSSQNHRKLAA
jgi:adenine-specific DNA-methyltransferase